MATTADIRNGLTIKYNNGLYTITEFQHVKPGKGPAFVRTKLKNVETGKVLDNTFSAGHKIETVRIERRQYQYLYAEEHGFHFMNTETYEQIFLEKQMVNAPQFLKDGLMCEVVFHAEEEIPLLCDLPQFIEAEITYTEPGVKGDTATNSTKPAKIDTGAEVRVPLFINLGDHVKIDTKESRYVERISK